MAEPQLEQTPRDRAGTLLALTLVAMVISVGVVGYVVYDNTLAHSSSASDPIEMGDTVTLDYIGMFTDGRVFDTSIYEIAEDDVLYPKSFTFQMRDESGYAPFDMEAGAYGVEGGTIKGFALGVLGLHVGDTSTIEVSPEDGYPVDPTMLVTIPLSEELPATESMSEAAFENLFNTDPIPMDFVEHYRWGWDVLVVEVSFGVVTFKHCPTVGETVYPFGDPNDDEEPQGWPCLVESFDPEADGGVGRIVVRHQVSADDVYNVMGTDNDGQVFILSGYDAENGTFEIHKSNMSVGYNAEVRGRTLIFEVTIISVKSV